MQEFELTKNDYIELNKLMKILDWVGSGGEANIMITEGEVIVNGEVEMRKRKKIRKGDIIEFADNKATIK